MLLKTADDKSARTAFLHALSQSPRLGPRERGWATQQLSRERSGIEGEKEAAYHLDRRYAKSDNHVLLHDLRLVVEDEVAQIDHLVITRGGVFFLIETKNYGANVRINDLGEFSVSYRSGDWSGVHSPIEQSKRHEAVLRKLLDRSGVNSRLAQVDMIHLVMFHPKAVIERPSAKAFDTSNVIKADQYDAWADKLADRVGTLTVLKSLVNARSLETIQDWAKRLLAAHQPADPQHLPAFIQQAVSVALPATPTQGPLAGGFATVGEKRLVCNHCGKKISYEEAKFCWSRGARFGNTQYCIEHQALFPSVRN